MVIHEKFNLSSESKNIALVMIGWFYQFYNSVYDYMYLSFLSLYCSHKKKSTKPSNNEFKLN